MPIQIENYLNQVQKEVFIIAKLLFDMAQIETLFWTSPKSFGRMPNLKFKSWMSSDLGFFLEVTINSLTFTMFDFDICRFVKFISAWLIILVIFVIPVILIDICPWKKAVIFNKSKLREFLYTVPLGDWLEKKKSQL